MDSGRRVGDVREHQPHQLSTQGNGLTGAKLEWDSYTTRLAQQYGHSYREEAGSINITRQHGNGYNND